LAERDRVGAVKGIVGLDSGRADEVGSQGDDTKDDDRRTDNPANLVAVHGYACRIGDEQPLLI